MNLQNRFIARWLVLAGAAIVGMLTGSTATAQLTVPRLIIERPAEQPVRLHSAKVDAQVTGSIAVTTIELSLHNPNTRALEGSVEFPLRDGQSVIGFASDVNGALREAVAIEKATGRQVFDDVVRRQIDPALLEKTAGNNYRLRVYPIRAAGHTRVQIRLMESLTEEPGGLEFRLPLGFASGVSKLDVSLRVADPGVTPRMKTNGIGVVALKPAGRYYELAVERENISKEAQITLHLPEHTGPQVITQFVGDERYFYAEWPLAPDRAPRTLPKSLAIVWDASGSGDQRKREDELRLLRHFLNKIGDVAVTLHVLRDRAEPPRHFTIRSGDSSALRTALEKLPFDGGTNLAALPVQPNADLMLLFSDGLHNFGDGRLTPPRQPVLAINSALQADSVRLRHLAQASGGAYIDLTAGYTPGAEAALLARLPAIVADLDASGISDLTVAPLAAGDRRLRLAGRLSGAAPALSLQLKGAKPARLTLAASDFSGAADSPYAARLWAQLRVDQLATDGTEARGEILRIAKAHALVTDETSLIVLERIEDYVRHEIVPPAELRAEYEQALRTARTTKAREQQRQTEDLVRAWAARKAWWEKDFPKDTPKPPPARKNAGDGPAPSDYRLGYASAPPADMIEERSLAAPAARAREREPNHPESMARLAPPRLAAAASLAGRRADPYPMADAAKVPGVAQTIRVKKWTSNAPYLRRFANAAPRDLYAVYLDEKPNYRDSPAFFLEAADRLAEGKQDALALRVLSNLAEMQLENRDLLRVLAGRLIERGQPKLAVPVLRRVLVIAPDEPQSLRDLAQALAESGETPEAVRLYVEVIGRRWDDRFGDIAEIALAELNTLLAHHPELEAKALDPRLTRNLPVGLRIVLSWDVDNTDVDLWVIDPNGEKVYYQHRESYQGGRLSRDVTQSYGPEEFIVKAPKPGKYQVFADFFGHTQQVISAGTTIEAQITTDFGGPRQKTERAVLRLTERKENALVAEIEVK